MLELPAGYEEALLPSRGFQKGMSLLLSDLLAREWGLEVRTVSHDGSVQARQFFEKVSATDFEVRDGHGNLCGRALRPLGSRFRMADTNGSVVCTWLAGIFASISPEPTKDSMSPCE